MNVQITLPIVVSIVAFVFTVYYNLSVRRKTDENEIKVRVERDTRVDMKLDEISRGVQDIRYDISALKKDVNKHDERLTLIEKSIDKAHSRIDTIAEIVEIKNGGGRHEKNMD